jgi:hypothetical protein
MGYSDLGCYVGELDTPAVDGLARRGVRLSQFYNTARCSPSRASVLTGLHPHRTGVGVLAQGVDDRPDGYQGHLSDRCTTVAEHLQRRGYRTALAGKWHLARSPFVPADTWPTRRGFDEFYGTLVGAGSYFEPRTLTRGEENVEHEAREPGFYYTDAITNEACAFVERTTTPFFLYVAYTAPHWPLHAHADDIAKYDGVFDEGWDILRARRLRTLTDVGLLDERAQLSPVTSASDRGSTTPGRWRGCGPTPRRSTAWTRESRASSARSATATSSTTRCSSSSPTTARRTRSCRRRSSRNVFRGSFPDRPERRRERLGMVRRLVRRVVLRGLAPRRPAGARDRKRARHARRLVSLPRLVLPPRRCTDVEHTRILRRQPRPPVRDRLRSGRRNRPLTS